MVVTFNIGSVIDFGFNAKCSWLGTQMVTFMIILKRQKILLAVRWKLDNLKAISHKIVSNFPRHMPKGWSNLSRAHYQSSKTPSKVPFKEPISRNKIPL